MHGFNVQKCITYLLYIDKNLKKKNSKNCLLDCLADNKNHRVFSAFRQFAIKTIEIIGWEIP